MIEARPEPRGVEAVDRALSLLDCFDEGAAELGLADLARRSGLPKSTVLRLAASLGRRSFLVRGSDGRFRPGPALWRLGSLYRGAVLPAEIIRSELRRLSERFGETASFYVRDGNRRVCLHRQEPARPIRHSLAEGQSLPLMAGASALVLRAFGKGGEPALAAVREAGHAVSRGARDPDVAAVAVPVLRNASLIGALTLSGPVSRFGTEHCGAMHDELARSAARLAPSPLEIG